MNLGNIPAELRELRQWVVYRDDKHPRHAVTLKPASVSDPSTWCSFEEARVTVKAGKAIGPGFVFTEDDNYVAIDLDSVIKDGHIDPEAQIIIDRMDSFTEVSKSGKGIHIIVRGSKPGSRCRKGNVEIYNKNRYFALTGDLWQDRIAIEDRQDDLEWLCSDIFGGVVEVTKQDTSVVLDKDAKPPLDEFMLLYKGDKEFKITWDYNNDSLGSMSDYDWKLATIASDNGWSDQQIADLIITFRRKNGTEDDLAKALRPDYIPRTLDKIRDSDEKGLLNLLPFKIKHILQVGEQESIFIIEMITNEGEEKSVQIGVVGNLLSAKITKEKLYEAGIFLEKPAIKRWEKITQEVMRMIEKVPVDTQEEITKGWVDAFMKSRSVLPLITEESDISEIFGSDLNSIAQDSRGRLYLHMNEATMFARVYTGMSGVSHKTVARDLIKLGFSKRKMTVTDEGKRKQISLWVSPIGFIGSGD